ncbi:leucine repeat adapter protein 25-like [Daphnia pulicaria]|uniref:leucine repeat adapter protein 25-like n=1 Tax=Daphnia pulicaria TaxID=35523 RepID=UPI001EE9FEE3|nr:leucine repeat adapter protein 25-like [Daphnia pulicaria]
MSLPGLPPVPKNLTPYLASPPKQTSKTPTINSGKAVRPLPRTPPREPPPPPPTTTSLGRKPSTLDTKLSILKKEMAGLRQVDMQLMNQLWSLQQSIQDLKCMMSASDLSPQSAVDPWELNHPQNNEEFYRSPYRLGAVNENDHISSSTSSISSGSGEKP